MGISRLAEWAQDILFILDRHESKISLIEFDIISKTFSGLIELRSFIEKFILFCKITDQFLKITKNYGLNKKTSRDIKQLLLKLPIRSKLYQRLFVWLTKHQELRLQMGIGSQSLLVSSDIIESLFGKFKSIIARSPSSELNKLIFIIPLLCGKRTQTELNAALSNCSHVEMQKHISDMVPITIRQQRIKLLKKTKNMVPILRNYKREKAA